MKSDSVHIGVDVSKEKLDIYNPITKASTSEPNTPEGFRKIREAARKANAVVCCEPTGGLEFDMIMFLQKYNIPVAYCDGYRVRHYALSTGEFSKNDKIDARMISRFADNINVRRLEEKDKAQIRLRRLWSLYQTLVDTHVVLAQKASIEPEKDIKNMLRMESKSLRKKAEKVLESCRKIIEENEELNRIFNTILLIDGVGQITALAVLAGIPELGKISDAAVAKLVGAVPMDNQSGKTDKSKHIHGGRKSVRNSLYMAAVASVRFNHILGAYYRQVRQRMPGPKASKWALVPVMRKLVHLMNRIARDSNFIPQKKPTIKAA
jgi:transposase